MANLCWLTGEEYVFVPEKLSSTFLTDTKEYGGYISDITRTWPINGKFSAPQRDLYSVVLNVLRACVSLCGESAGLSLDRLHSIAENNLKEQLTQLGFDVTGDVCLGNSMHSQLLTCILNVGHGVTVPPSPWALHRAGRP